VGDINIITDRPDATESPNTVPIKSLQIETGAFNDSYKDMNVTYETRGYHTTLLRYGLLERLELRVGWHFEEGKTKTDGIYDQDITSGFSPLLLGVKVEIVKENGLLPTIGLLGHLMLPFTAASDYRPETTGIDFRFSFGHTLCERSSIGYNIGAQWGDDSSEASYVYTLVYGYSITKKLGAYAEVYGDIPEDNRANHYWDVGLVYLVKNNFQLDATLGRSFTEGQDLLISGGFSYQLSFK
jgi:hypothetical protein